MHWCEYLEIHASTNAWNWSWSVSVKVSAQAENASVVTKDPVCRQPSCLVTAQVSNQAPLRKPTHWWSWIWTIHDIEAGRERTKTLHWMVVQRINALLNQVRTILWKKSTTNLCFPEVRTFGHGALKFLDFPSWMMCLFSYRLAGKFPLPVDIEARIAALPPPAPFQVINLRVWAGNLNHHSEDIRGT